MLLQIIFHFQLFQTSSGVSLASYAVGRVGGYFAGNTDSVEVKLIAQIVPKLRMRGAIPPFPQMTRCCIKHRDNCTFTLLFPYPCLVGLSGCLSLNIKHESVDISCLLMHN